MHEAPKKLAGWLLSRKLMEILWASPNTGEPQGSKWIITTVTLMSAKTYSNVIYHSFQHAHNYNRVTKC